MPKFRIQLEETVYYVCDVEADTKADAIAFVQYALDNGEEDELDTSESDSTAMIISEEQTDA